MLVALGEHFEQQFGPGWGWRHAAEFIDDQQLDRLQFALGLEQAPLIAGFHQVMYQSCRSGEGDRRALLASGQPQGEGDMGLAGARVRRCQCPTFQRIAQARTLLQRQT